MSNHEISFNTKLSEAVRTPADFIYKITPTVISVIDTGLGSRSVTEDIEAVLRKIEYWHQGAIARYRISYMSTLGSEHLVEWDGQTARVRPPE